MADTVRADNAFFAAVKRGEAKGAYYFYGAEGYLLERAVESAERSLDAAMRELNCTHLRAPSAAQVVDACEALPFFAEKRLVLVREMPAEEGALLAPYLASVPDTTLLLLVAREKGKSGGGKSKAGADKGKSADGAASDAGGSKLLAAAKKLGRAVEFAPYDENLAVQFIGKCARESGVAIDRSAAVALVRMIGTDLFALETALHKAAAYAGYGNPVTVKALEAVVEPNTEVKIFAVLDWLLAGNQKAGITELLGLLRNGESAMGLAAFLEGRVKLVLRARQALDSGMNAQAAAKSLGGSPYAAEMAVKNARRASCRRLTALLCALAEVDALQKQGRAKDTDLLLLAMLQSV